LERKDSEILLAPTGKTQKRKTQIGKTQSGKTQKGKTQKGKTQKGKIQKVVAQEGGDMSEESYSNRLASGYMHRPGVPSLAYMRLV
jgi:hypothetical protein